MQFRLVYHGRLPAASADGKSRRTKEKHEIRRELHKQLAELWKTQSFLRQFVERELDSIRHHQALARKYSKCGYNFLPLIGHSISGVDTACSLDILFLRRDPPGSLIKSGGDIDNSIKVLFDALRVPADCSEVTESTPAPDEDPFYCLLEDDKLIQEVRVTTDQLLTPLAADEGVNDVHLVIHVRTFIFGGSGYSGYMAMQT
jgi:hypothetical protein